MVKPVLLFLFLARLIPVCLVHLFPAQAARVAAPVQEGAGADPGAAHR